MNSWSEWPSRTPFSGMMEKAVSLSGWHLMLSELCVSPGIRGCRLGFMICQWKASSTCLWEQELLWAVDPRPRLGP